MAPLIILSYIMYLIYNTLKRRKLKSPANIKKHNIELDPNSAPEMESTK